MKQVLTILAIMAATSVPASLFAAKTTATCSLINPPNSEIKWVFGGNQVIWVKFSNSNVLNVAVEVVCNTLFDQTDKYIILPLSSTKEKKYSIFGNTPISWKFTVSTLSDAASVVGNARWDAY